MNDTNLHIITDRANGNPEESITFAKAGVIFLVPGSGEGVVGEGALLQAQDMLSSELREANDLFGSATATGDYNGDGFDDLAVSARNETVGSAATAGAISVTFARVNSGRLLLVER